MHTEQGFEYANDNLVYNNLSAYVKHPTHGLNKGQYTDDTQMSIALAELLLSDLAWTPYNIVAKFLECFKRDERPGYSKLFQKFLEATNTPEEFLANIKNDSDRSGGAMRASCLGFVSDLDELVEKTTIQCKVTHNTPDGINAALAAALTSWYMLHDKGAVSDLGAFLNKRVPCSTDWAQDYVGKVKAKGWMSVQAAVTALRRNNTLSRLLVDCVNFSGDVDTVATIALSAASCSSFYTQDLPDSLVWGLECGKYGREYLLGLDEQLKNKFK